MALVKMKPTSPGRRFMIQSVNNEIYRGRPIKSLIEIKKRSGGRNNLGRITTRHIGGGAKKLYRKIDFKRDKIGINGKVERIEHDPNRSALIALITYADGERRYIIAPKGISVGDKIESGPEAPIKPGNTMKLRNLPIGSTIHGIELSPGKGAQLVRTAGNSAVILGREGNYTQIRLRSGEVRKIFIDCMATLGEISNSEHSLQQLGKAGANRWKGVRPTVRGEVMNPVDHPMGGRTRGNRQPCSPWGQPAKGFKTRRNKRTQKMIISDRHKTRKQRR